jgi:hypothetical protein
MKWRGEPVADTPRNRNRADLDYDGRACPPPDAASGACAAPDGSTVKVEPLTDEDRRTLVRWIDLGCPIDLDYDPARPERRGYGWACDDQRPTLTLAYPAAGANERLTRVVVGACDAYSGLDERSLSVTADFPVDGAAPGSDLAAKFKPSGPGTWELKLLVPVDALPTGTLNVSIKDRQGNLARLVRTFSVGPAAARAERASDH